MGDNIDIKKKILLEAKKIYAEKGFAGTSMRDIAQAASVNLSLIYYYFKNKEGLFIAVLEEGFFAISEKLQNSLSKSDDTIESIKNFVRAFLSYVMENKYHSRIMQQEILLHNGTYLREIAARYEIDSLNSIERILKKGIEEGVLRSFDYRLAYFSLLGMMVYFVMSKGFVLDKLQREEYDSDFINQLVEHITELFLEGAKKDVKI